MGALLCQAEASQLLLIDIQTRLAGAMGDAARERVVDNAAILAKAAALLEVPQLVTEQYPRGLGPTEPELDGTLAGAIRFEKTCFACTGAEGFSRRLADHHRPQVVVAGMESHVCVLQTMLELEAAGYQVFVVEDAICSRREQNHRNAVERMRASAVITNTESVLFEWLRNARHDHFKSISAMIK